VRGEDDRGGGVANDLARDGCAAVTTVAVQAPRAGWRPTGALVALTLGAFLYVTTETLPIGLLDPIARDLRVTVSRVGLLVTAYGLIVVLASIPLARLTRAVPRRVLVCGLLGLYVASALASAVAPGYGGLVVARVFTALSQALFWSVVVPVAAGLFPVEVRGAGAGGRVRRRVAGRGRGRAAGHLDRAAPPGSPASRSAGRWWTGGRGWRSCCRWRCRRWRCCCCSGRPGPGPRWCWSR
jgi:MFS family permease